MINSKFFLFIICFFFHISHINASEVNKNQKLSWINQQIQKISNLLKTDKSQQTLLFKELKTVEIRIGDYTKELNKINIVLNKKELQLQAFQKNSDMLNLELSQQKDLLISQLKSYYQLGKDSRIKLFLNPQNYHISHRLLSYHGFITKARYDLIKNLLTILERLQRNQVLIKNETQILKDVAFKKAYKMRILSTEFKKRQEILDEINQQIQSNELQLQELIKNKQVLENLLKKIDKNTIRTPSISTSIIPFANMKGKFHPPINGKISTKFGSHHYSNRLKYNGILIAAKSNQNIRSIYKGKVVFADWLRGYGLLIIIDHLNGYMSLYAHNASLNKKIGDNVMDGEIIGTAGRSGGIKENSLYFEIRKDGKPLDPEPWFKKIA